MKERSKRREPRATRKPSVEHRGKTVAEAPSDASREANYNEVMRIAHDVMKKWDRALRELAKS
jgi:hypothetical protein